MAVNMASPALMAEYTGCGGEVHVWVRVGEKLSSYMVALPQIAHSQASWLKRSYRVKSGFDAAEYR